MSITLYVKTHNVTGMKYFGKTTKKDVHKYTGSGVYWKRHLKKHGMDYTTEVVGVFEDQELCENFALEFSQKNKIIQSDEWANLQDENGLDGAPKGHAGHKFTTEQLESISKSSKENWKNPTFREKIVSGQRSSWTDERKEEQSNRLTGVKRPDHSKLMKQKSSDPNVRKKASEFFSNLERTDTHKNNISKALSGKSKTEEHKKKLRVPKLRCCRLSDRKEMSVNHFNRKPI